MTALMLSVAHAKLEQRSSMQTEIKLRGIPIFRIDDVETATRPATRCRR